jgi:hypothetical protein
VHGLERAVATKLLEHVVGDEVARVQNEVGLLQSAHALFREGARSTWHVRVRDDRDEDGQRDLRFCLAGFPTRNALLTNTALRVTFSSAVSRMP